MARKSNKQTLKRVVGCLVLSAVVSGCGQSKPVTTEPILLTRTHIPNYGVRVDVDQDFVIAQADVDLRNCPQFGCDVVETVVAGERLELVGMIAGESLNGFEGWFEIEDDKRPLYAHLHLVMPMDATAQAGVTPTPSPTNDRRFVTPRPSNTPRVAPTLAPTSDEAVEDVTDFSATMYANDNAIIRACASTTCQNLGRVDAGSAVVVTGIVDGEIVETGYTIWYRVEHGGVIGYVYQRLLASDAPTNGNVSPTMFVCPQNCDEAVARGMGASEIAQLCPRLDRDKDGQACYGD